MQLTSEFDVPLCDPWPSDLAPHAKRDAGAGAEECAERRLLHLCETLRLRVVPPPDNDDVRLEKRLRSPWGHGLGSGAALGRALRKRPQVVGRRVAPNARREGDERGRGRVWED